MDSISVDADSGASRINRASLPPAQKSAAKSDPRAESSANLTDVQALSTKVKSAGPDVRPEAVQRGKALVDDPNWPSDEILDKLAGKLLKDEDFDS